MPTDDSWKYKKTTVTSSPPYICLYLAIRHATFCTAITVPLPSRRPMPAIIRYAITRHKERVRRPSSWPGPKTGGLVPRYRKANQQIHLLSSRYSVRTNLSELSKLADSVSGIIIPTPLAPPLITLITLITGISYGLQQLVRS